MKEHTLKRMKRGMFETKTWVTNKSRLNAKAAMDPKFKKGVVISMEQYYDEEDNQSKQVEQFLSGVLGKIKQGLQAFPDLLGDTCIIKEEP